MERACTQDPFLSLERRGNALVLRVEPAVDPEACGIEIEMATEVGS